MVRLSLAPPRCYLAGLRIHHGLTGVLLVAGGLIARKRGLFVLGALLALEDFRDLPWSLFDA